MRVLVLTTERDWSMSTRLLLTVAEGLARRGASVTACYPRASDTAAGAEAGFPNVALRSMSDGGLLTHWRAVRFVVAATRSSAVLVHGERDALVAAFAIGRSGGVVRRRHLDEPVQTTWRSRAAAARTRVVLFDGHQGLPGHGADVAPPSLAWPPPSQRAAHGSDVVGTVGAVGEPHPRVVLFPPRDASPNANTPVALRTAAQLLTRYDTLRVALVGDETTLQGTRIHAASLGLADRLDLISVDGFLSNQALDATAVWITADGDEGALALVSAMTRSLPVVVPSGSNIAAFVVPRVTGLVADGDDVSATVAALARMMADRDERRVMGEAAAARAARVHGWSSWLDRVSESLQRASGTRRTRPAGHGVPTPA